MAGEGLEAALARELREELGIEIATPHLLARVSVPTSEGAADYQIFLVTDWRGEPMNQQVEEHDEVGWFTPDRAKELTLADDGYRALFDQAITLSSRA